MASYRLANPPLSRRNPVAYNLLNFLLEIHRPLVATRYRSGSTASSPPVPSSDEGVFGKAQTGREGGTCWPQHSL